MKFAQKNRFGNKSRSLYPKDKRKDDTIDRNNGKDHFDGSFGTLLTESMEVEEHSSTPPVKKGRDLSNCPESYKEMFVNSEPVFHPSDLSKVSGRIIEKKTINYIE